MSLYLNFGANYTHLYSYVLVSNLLVMFLDILKLLGSPRMIYLTNNTICLQFVYTLFEGVLVTVNYKY